MVLVNACTGGLKDGYMSGGAGYVLSRAALRRFVTCLHNTSFNCRQDSAGDEDVEMARCLQSCGVKMGDSTDSAGLNRFTSGTLHLIMSQYLTTREDKADSRIPARCCSNNSISFHSVPVKVMTVLNYLIYRLKRNETGKTLHQC
jgi:glycoprotein-N-acetylgalactosamine 3-beta-galactosyltransferase